MVGHTSSSTDDEDLALALELSQLSSDACDERVQLSPGRSGSASPAPRPKTPLNDKKDDRVLAPGMPQQSDELVSQLPSGASGLTGSDALSSQTVPHCDENRELAFDLFELPANISGAQVDWLDPGKESCMGDNDNRASLLTATSVGEVRIPLSPHKT